MKEYRLSNKDIERINRIMDTTKAIEGLYNKLYELEINKENNTDEYQKQIGFLKNLINIERNLYEKSQFNSEKCIALIAFITRSEPNVNCYDEERIINQNYNNLYIRRIFSELCNISLTDDEVFKDIYLDDCDNISKEKEKEIIKEERKCLDVINQFDVDIINSCFLFIQESINNKQHKYYENELIKSKYGFSFVNKIIENQLINNNFNVTENLYLGSKFFSDMLKIETESYNSMKEEYVKSVLVKQIDKLLKLEDLDYNNKNKAISSILKSFYIRACLLLLENETIDYINDSFNDYIKNHEWNNNISKQIIINCFKNINQDKNKVKILSLK